MKYWPLLIIVPFLGLIFSAAATNSADPSDDAAVYFPPAALAQRSDIILEGVVEKVHEQDVDTYLRAGKRAFGYRGSVRIYTVSVSGVLKGPERGTVQVWSLSDAQLPNFQLRRGDRTIFFLYRDEHNGMLWPVLGPQGVFVATEGPGASKFRRAIEYNWIFRSAKDAEEAKIEISLHEMKAAITREASAGQP